MDYGHTAGVKPGMLISKAQAEEYLKADLIAFERYLNGLGLALNQNQFDALVSFIYNVGTGNFSNSTLLARSEQIRRKTPSWMSSFAGYIPKAVFFLVFNAED